MAGTINRRKQNADTLCHGKSRFCSWDRSPRLYLPSTSLRTCSNNLRISLRQRKLNAAKGELDLLRALVANGVYLDPESLAPLNQQFAVLIHVSGTLAAPNWVHLNRHLFVTQSTEDITNAGLQKRFAVPRHARLHDLGQNGVTTEECLVSYLDEDVNTAMILN